MRKILVDFMISEEFYLKKVNSESKVVHVTRTKVETAKSIDEVHPKALDNLNYEEVQPLNYKQEVYIRALGLLKPIVLPPIYINKSAEILNLDSKLMVDEFLYWCIRFEFPENLVKYLLSLLPDLRYKQIFIKSFVSQYSYISMILLNSRAEHLSSRVVHISVQLFSNEAIAMKALEESHLLPIIMSTLYNMIAAPWNENGNDPRGSVLIKSQLENEKSNGNRVIDPDHVVMQENLYWLVISDMVNLLSHRGVALEFLANAELVGIWLELVSYFQAMNLNVRKFGEHVQQEQPTYFSSFSAELEFCSSVMWSFLQHLRHPSQSALTKTVLHHILNNLRKWSDGVGLGHSFEYRPNPSHITFHLPLHRYFAAFVYNAVYEQAARLEDLIGSDLILFIDILAHPLQLQIGFHEIHANMWVRNGLQMKGQAMTYVQNHFCTSFSDLDLFLIQVLASRLSADLFMKAFFERFHLMGWLEQVNKSRRLRGSSAKGTESSSSKSVVSSVVESIVVHLEGPDSLEPAHQTAMLLGALTVLAQIITIKPNLSFNNFLLTRTEVVNLLCVNDRTYSQVEESIPDMCSLSAAKKFIQPILANVADFLQPTLDSLSIGSLKQGRYKPKDEIWLNEYDPLYVMLRSVKRKEFQESFDRYCQFAEKIVSNSGSKSAKKLWPPFRLPNKVDSSDEEMAPEADFVSADDLDAFTRKEKTKQARVDRELIAKSRILNTKSLHAILLTILYEVSAV